jgi:hypothetical protein
MEIDQIANVMRKMPKFQEQMKLYGNHIDLIKQVSDLFTDTGI